MAKKENNRDYSGLVESTLKSRYGAKWGLYKYNLERKAQAYMKYAKEEITRDLKYTPKDLKGFVEYGILQNVSKYSLSSREFKGVSSETRLKKLDLARTEKFASEFSEDDITIEKDGSTTVILSPATLNMLYRDNAITREEWLKGLEEFRNSAKSYLYSGYASKQS